jgi:anti-sigma regulatory factor (Ser/Thr protein kinase)
LNIYSRKSRWKFLLLVVAVLIGLSSLYYTNQLVKDLSEEEREKVALWAKATQKLIEMDIDENNFELLFEVLENNNTVPVILATENGDTLSTRNLDSKKLNHPRYLERQLTKMKASNEPIIISLGEGENQYVYFKDSLLLTRLQYFPYIQLGVIFLFILVSYFAFSSSRKAEQNQVWVGLSKETAHQLGTPTSSLMAWLELLKMKKADENSILELEKDVKRLEKIADRFSKIGSRPILEQHDLIKVLQQAIEYIKTRSSEKTVFEMISVYKEPLMVEMNPGLFEWVIENLCKNAMDAMGGDGKITVEVVKEEKWVHTDIVDRGKGIPKNLHKTIFKPGYTSKPRGWGLGLSLSKRIVEQYHSGKVYVVQSEPGKGTRFRVSLKCESSTII